MENDFSALLKGLMGMANGKAGAASFENVIKILSTDEGKRVISELMSDGGESVKKAAEAAKRGDASGIGEIISRVAKTPEGASVLAQILKSREG